VRRGYKVLHNKPKTVCKKTNCSFVIDSNTPMQVFSYLFSLKRSFSFLAPVFSANQDYKKHKQGKKKTLRSLNSNDLLRNLFRASALSQPLVII
jgi:hypothetical protein